LVCADGARAAAEAQRGAGGGWLRCRVSAGGCRAPPVSPTPLPALRAAGCKRRTTSRRATATCGADAPPMEQQAAAAPSRPKTSVGFTVGEFAPPPAPAPEPEAAAYAGDGAVDEREYDSEDEYDEDEYDSEEWEFDEEYWTDEEEEQGQGFGRRRKPSRPRVKVPAVLKKQAEQKKHKQIMAEGGVAWQPNKSAKECQQCEKKFTIKVRRHHCRRCGGIFCASCSGKSLAREGQVLEPMRACDTCVAEVEVQPMFAWLSRRRAVPKTAEEIRSALVKVLQFSTNAKMQSWLLSPYTHM
jgi:hypothetical protein